MQVTHVEDQTTEDKASQCHSCEYYARGICCLSGEEVHSDDHCLAYTEAKD